MGWIARRRAKRDAEQAAAVAAAVERAIAAREAQVDPMLSMVKLVNEITKGRLEVAKADSEIELARLKATADERAEDRKLEHENRLKKREEKRAQSERMRAQRIANSRPALAPSELGKSLPAEIAACEECRAALEGRAPAHQNDMWIHAKRSHPKWLKNWREQNRSAAVSHASNG